MRMDTGKKKHVCIIHGCGRSNTIKTNMIKDDLLNDSHETSYVEDNDINNYGRFSVDLQCDNSVLQSDTIDRHLLV